MNNGNINHQQQYPKTMVDTIPSGIVDSINNTTTNNNTTHNGTENVITNGVALAMSLPMVIIPLPATTWMV